MNMMYVYMCMMYICNLYTYMCIICTEIKKQSYEFEKDQGGECQKGWREKTEGEMMFILIKQKSVVGYLHNRLAMTALPAWPVGVQRAEPTAE